MGIATNGVVLFGPMAGPGPTVPLDLLQQDLILMQCPTPSKLWC